MGIKRRLSRLWEETKDGVLRGPGVDVESVKADDQTINESVTYPDGTTVTTSPSGGGVVSNAGYETGDYIVYGPFGPGFGRSFSTTSTSFKANSDVLDASIQWDAIEPTNGDLHIGLSVKPGGISSNGVARVRNNFDGDDIAATEITGSERWSGFGNYDPPTTDSPIRLVGSLSSTDGNQAAVSEYSVWLGVPL